MKKQFLLRDVFGVSKKNFYETDGVIATRAVYTGGHRKNPSYHDVCGKNTGHAEAVEVTFNPKVISCEALLNVFFNMHDATNTDKQGSNHEGLYRSAIFYLSDVQQQAAEAFVNNHSRHIVTQIVPASIFWDAEAKHQKYY